MPKGFKGERGTVAGSKPADQAMIRWDDKNFRAAYDNVCNVTGTREETVFLFSLNQALRSGQKELTIPLADRIVMSPFVAKRLDILLNSAVRKYESYYGPLEIEWALRRPG